MSTSHRQPNSHRRSRKGVPVCNAYTEIFKKLKSPPRKESCRLLLKFSPFNTLISLDHAQTAVYISTSPKDGLGDTVAGTRETREGWLLLTVETEVNGELKSTDERGPWVVR